MERRASPQNGARHPPALPPLPTTSASRPQWSAVGDTPEAPERLVAVRTPPGAQHLPRPEATANNRRWVVGSPSNFGGVTGGGGPPPFLKPNKCLLRQRPGHGRRFGSVRRGSKGGGGGVGLAASCRSRPSGVGFLPCPTTRLNYLTVRFQGRADYRQPPDPTEAQVGGRYRRPVCRRARGKGCGRGLGLARGGQVSKGGGRGGPGPKSLWTRTVHFVCSHDGHVGPGATLPPPAAYGHSNTALGPAPHPATPPENPSLLHPFRVAPAPPPH